MELFCVARHASDLASGGFLEPGSGPLPLCQYSVARCDAPGTAAPCGLGCVQPRLARSSCQTFVVVCAPSLGVRSQGWELNFSGAALPSAVAVNHVSGIQQSHVTRDYNIE